MAEEIADDLLSHLLVFQLFHQFFMDAMPESQNNSIIFDSCWMRTAPENGNSVCFFGFEGRLLDDHTPVQLQTLDFSAALQSQSACPCRFRLGWAWRDTRRWRSSSHGQSFFAGLRTHRWRQRNYFLWLARRHRLFFSRHLFRFRSKSAIHKRQFERQGGIAIEASLKLSEELNCAQYLLERNLGSQSMEFSYFIRQQIKSVIGAGLYQKQAS